MIIIHHIEIDKNEEDIERQKKIKNPIKTMMYKHQNDYKILLRLNAWDISEINSALQSAGYDKKLTELFKKLTIEAFNEIKRKNKLN